MKAKTFGVLALVGVLSIGLLSGVAMAASPSSAGAVSDAVDSMSGYGPHGTCTMDQTRAQNQTCDGQGMMNSFGPNGGPGGQFGNGPGYPDCPLYPCGNCTK